MDNSVIIRALGRASEYPLHWACYNGDINEVRRLICLKSADPNQINSSGFVPLFFACVKNHVECVKLLLSKGANVNLANDNSFTQLHVVSVFGFLDCTKLLLKYGANINAFTKNKNTALHLAVKHKHIDVVNYLLEQDGIDILAKNTNNLTAWDLAVSNGLANKLPKLKDATNPTTTTLNSTSIPKLEYSNAPDKINALFSACMIGNEAEVRRLISDEKVNPNCRDLDTRKTPLHKAATRGHYIIVKFLLENNADVNAKTNNGETALHIACKKNLLKIVQLLLESGRIDINSTTCTGDTAIHVACYEGIFELVKLLLERGADPSVINLDGKTPWEVAVKAGYNWNLWSFKSALTKRPSKYGTASLKLP